MSFAMDCNVYKHVLCRLIMEMYMYRKYTAIDQIPMHGINSMLAYVLEAIFSMQLSRNAWANQCPRGAQ